MSLLEITRASVLFSQKFKMQFDVLLPWVPEVSLLCGGNFRCWPKADTSSAVKTSQKPETALEKSLAPRVTYYESENFSDFSLLHIF